MALTAKSAALAKAMGGNMELVYGVAGGSGATTTVTIPQFKTCLGAIVGGATSATSPYCDTVSTNTFTATHANNNKFAYIAFGVANI